MDMEPLFNLDEYHATQSKEEKDEPDMLAIYLGEEQAAIVVSALGGLSMRVPSTSSGARYTHLEKALGTELANKLISHFGGEELYIPNKHDSEVKQRHRHVRTRYAELRKKLSNTRAIQELAKEMKLSDRQIRRILDPPT